MAEKDEIKHIWFKRGSDIIGKLASIPAKQVKTYLDAGWIPCDKDGVPLTDEEKAEVLPKKTVRRKKRGKK